MTIVSIILLQDKINQQQSSIMHAWHLDNCKPIDLTCGSGSQDFEMGGEGKTGRMRWSLRQSGRVQVSVLQNECHTDPLKTEKKGRRLPHLSPPPHLLWLLYIVANIYGELQSRREIHYIPYIVKSSFILAAQAEVCWWMWNKCVNITIIRGNRNVISLIFI